MSFRLTPEERECCLTLARKTLVESFGGESGAYLSSLLRQVPQNSPLRKSLPCFVSLHSKQGRLRGCIGNTTTDLTLLENIARFARAAAFEDPRFRPVAENELGELVIEISVLGPQMLLESLSLLVIGTHGLRVTTEDRSGLLLAQVAKEFAWERDEFARQTCIKAGLDPKQYLTYSYSYFEQIQFSEE